MFLSIVAGLDGPFHFDLASLQGVFGVIGYAVPEIFPFALYEVADTLTRAIIYLTNHGDSTRL